MTTLPDLSMWTLGAPLLVVLILVIARPVRHLGTGAALISVLAAIVNLAASLRMEEFLDRRTEGFSSGQRMKVALARAMIHKPQNLILDEPSRGLDVMSIRLLREILHKLRADGCCIMFSSHVMAEVELLSDHIVMIAHGRVTAEGSAADLKAQAQCDDLEDAFVRLASLDEKDA